MRTAAIVVVHVALTAVVLAYIADVALPFYAFRSDSGGALHAATVPAPIAWSQGPLLLLRHPHQHAQQLAQHVVHSDSTAAAALNSAVLWRSSVFQLVLAAVTYVVLTHVVPAPYGRHAQRLRFPLTLPSRVSWMLQESPTLLNVLYFILVEYPRVMGHWPLSSGGGAASPCASHPTACSTVPAAHVQARSYGSCGSYWDCVLSACAHQHLGLLLFVVHYVHRSWLYPLAIPASAHRVPLIVTWSATLYCAFNGRLQVLASASAAAAATVKGAGGAASGWLPPSTQLLRCWRAGHVTSSLALLLYVCGVFGGAALFFYGQRMNMRADYYLVSLRGSTRKGTNRRLAAVLEAKEHSAHEHVELHRKDDGSVTEATADVHPSGYKIPVGGWFDSVSCPNFLGELVEWVGYTVVVAATTAGTGCGAGSPLSMNGSTDALADGLFSALRSPENFCRSSLLLVSPVCAAVEVFATPSALAAFSFLVYVWCNLAPRAREHHRWYSQTFGVAYDALQRKALLPGLY